MPTTFTRAEIIEKLFKDLKLSRNQSVNFLEVTLEEIIESLANQGGLKIASFGSFKVRKKSKRIGRNPKTGEKAVITSRRVLSFHPSSHLKNKVKLYKA